MIQAQIMKPCCNDTTMKIKQYSHNTLEGFRQYNAGKLLSSAPPCLALEKQSMCVDKEKKWKLPKLIFCWTELIHWWCFMLRVFEAVASSSVKQCDQHISWGPRSLWIWNFQKRAASDLDFKVSTGTQIRTKKKIKKTCTFKVSKRERAV